MIVPVEKANHAGFKSVLADPSRDLVYAFYILFVIPNQNANIYNGKI